MNFFFISYLTQKGSPPRLVWRFTSLDKYVRAGSQVYQIHLTLSLMYSYIFAYIRFDIRAYNETIMQHFYYNHYPLYSRCKSKLVHRVPWVEV